MGQQDHERNGIVPLQPVFLSDSCGMFSAIYSINAMLLREGKQVEKTEAYVKEVLTMLKNTNFRKLSLLLQEWHQQKIYTTELERKLRELILNFSQCQNLEKYNQSDIQNEIVWSALATAYDVCIAIKYLSYERDVDTNKSPFGWKIAVPVPAVFGHPNVSEKNLSGISRCVFLVSYEKNNRKTFVPLIPINQEIFHPGKKLTPTVELDSFTNKENVKEKKQILRVAKSTDSADEVLEEKKIPSGEKISSSETADGVGTNSRNEEGRNPVYPKEQKDDQKAENLFHGDSRFDAGSLDLKKPQEEQNSIQVIEDGPMEKKKNDLGEIGLLEEGDIMSEKENTQKINQYLITGEKRTNSENAPFRGGSFPYQESDQDGRKTDHSFHNAQMEIGNNLETSRTTEANNLSHDEKEMPKFKSHSQADKVAERTTLENHKDGNPFSLLVEEVRIEELTAASDLYKRVYGSSCKI